MTQMNLQNTQPAVIHPFLCYQMEESASSLQRKKSENLTEAVEDKK